LTTLGLNADISNAPDAMLCPINVCGRVEAVYQDIPDYGPYRGFNAETACWVKQYGLTVDFSIGVIIPPSKRFEETPLP